MKKMKLTNFNNIPKPISNKETNELFLKFYNGDMKARDKIITHNLKLVVKELYRKYWNVLYDKNDMFEIGVIGLINAVDNFDITKEIQFSTFAVTCIDNEINRLLNKLEFEPHEFELTIQNPKANNQNFYYDEIKLANTNLIEDVEENVSIYDSLKYLDEREKQIIILYFGLYNNISHTQKELSEIFGLTQSGIAYIIDNCLEKIKCLMTGRKITKRKYKKRK